MPKVVKRSRKSARSVRKSKSSKKTKCPKGMIRRSAYTKKSGVRVKSACVPDKGRPGKGGPVKVSLDEKHLGKYGYSLKKSSSARMRAIQKAIKVKGARKVLSRLVLLRTYRKYNKKSAEYKKLDKDILHLREKYFAKRLKKAASKSRKH